MRGEKSSNMGKGKTEMKRKKEIKTRLKQKR